MNLTDCKIFLRFLSFYKLFKLFILITIFSTPKCFSQNNYKQMYNNCEKLFTCGSDFENVGYPFYGGDRPHYCGHPDFELKCENDDVPHITIGPVTYRGLRVIDAERILKVARDDLWDNLCSPSPYNTSFDPKIFNYSTNYPTITIYHDCPAESLSVPNRFCVTTGSNIFSFYLPTNEPLSNFAIRPISCQNNITVPVEPSAFPRLSNLNSSVEDLIAALRRGFELLWSANDTICSQCTQTEGRCGYDPVSGFICYCSDGRYGLDCSNSSQASGDSSISLPLKLLIAASSVVSLIVILIALCCYRRKRWSIEKRNEQNIEAVRRNGQNIEAFLRQWNSLAIKKYTYREIKKITNSFGEKLGEGGYGSVYKGKLLDGRLVAVKVLSEAKGDGQDFFNEVSSISRTCHVNIVTLFGFCYNRRRALVYEFMPNGSLDKFVNTSELQNSNCLLEWKKLYQVAVGIARGLEYLHRGCNTRIVHFDIKPHNILLDGDFCPKISDFGLAKLSERKESILSSITTRGTIGYIAPEVFSRQFGGVSYKSDVYSYGMMILEMVGVRKNVAQADRSSDVYFPKWIYEHLELGKDLNIVQAFRDEEDEELSRKMMIVGLCCIQTNPSHRPSMSKVMEMLEGSFHSLQIPPKPFLYSPPRSPEHPSASFSVGTNISVEN